MPGPGKSRWIRLDTKTTVEETLKLPISFLRKHLWHESSGTATWRWSETDESSIRYFVASSSETFTVTLAYRRRDTDEIRIPVRLQTTPTHFGGKRWWFTCPLVLNDVPCSRRVGTIYLPPGAKYFGCRHCHNLAYRSSQEAHQDERAFCLLTGGRGFDRELFERFMGRMRGER